MKVIFQPRTAKKGLKSLKSHHGNYKIKHVLFRVIFMLCDIL